MSVGIIIRCEAFNKLVKNTNIHSNKQAPSRDIAAKFSKLEHLRLMCSSGRCVSKKINVTNTLICNFYRCGKGVERLLENSHVSYFLHGTTLTSLSRNKRVYFPGELRKVRDIMVIYIIKYSIIQERGHTTTIGRITVKDHGEKEKSILELRSTDGFNWCSELSLSSMARIYGAVVAQNGILINTGDNVAFSDEDSDKVLMNNGRMFIVLNLYFVVSLW